MRIARPIRVDVGKAEYLLQSLDKARFVGLIGLCESAVYVKHHEFHGKCECRLTRYRRKFAIKGEHFSHNIAGTSHHGAPACTAPDLIGLYVSAMAWKELTTSSGPASVKKDS